MAHNIDEWVDPYSRRLNAEEDARLAQIRMTLVTAFAAGLITGLMIAAWLIGGVK